MKRINLLWLMLGMVVVSFPAYAQVSRHITLYESGLLYSDSTMAALRKIVQRENERFRAGKPGQPMRALPQAPCRYMVFRADTDDLDVVAQDMQRGVQPLVVRERYARYLLSDVPCMVALPGRYRSDHVQRLLSASNYWIGSELPPTTDPTAPGHWQVDNSPRNDLKSFDQINGLWYPAALDTPSLHPELQRCMQYVDWLVDTTTTTFLISPPRGSLPSDYPPPEDMKPIVVYLQQWTPSMTLMDLYGCRYNEKLMALIERQLKLDTTFKRIMLDVTDTMIAKRKGSMALETIMHMISEPQRELQLKRCRFALAMCWADPDLTIHALEIAQLAAETQDWSVFIRAHLDVLFDRGDVNAWAIYANEHRYSFIYELEELGVDVVDLAIGMVATSYDCAANHYAMRPLWMGKAMSESRDSARFVETLTRLLRDPAVDARNRYALLDTYYGYIYRSYNLAKAQREYDAFMVRLDEFPEDVRTIAQTWQRPVETPEYEE